MVTIEPRIFDELKQSLTSFGNKYFVGEELNRSKLVDDLRNYDELLLAALFDINFIREHYLVQVANQTLFQIEKLQDAILYNGYWDTSYTKYENRIGLASNNKYLQDNQDVVLDFPFKDCILTASMTKEDNDSGYDDAFLNEVIEKDEIDRLFDKKILKNIRHYGDFEGEQESNPKEILPTFDKEKDNLIIKGNNLLALYTIADKYAGSVKLIYIDPPYNTGSDSFAYNDKFNHSAWLTFMKNRLEIAKELLTDDGMIFVQTDDKEHAYLKVLMDSIFGQNKYLNTVVIKAKASSGASGGGEDKRLKKNVEFLLVYANDNAQIKIQTKPFLLSKYISERKEQGKNFAYTNVLINGGELIKIGETVDGRGEKIELYDVQGYETISVSKLAKKENLTEDEIYVKYLDKIYTTENAQTSIRQRVRDCVKDNGYTIARYVPVSGRNKGKITDVGFIGSTKRLVSFLSDTSYVEDGVAYKTEKAGTLWEDISWSSIKNEGGVELKSGKKPEKLLQRIIASGTEEGDIVMDFFMGSGSTQATALKMNRRFLGMEQIDEQWEKAVQRLINTVNGDQTGISKDVNWQGGGTFFYAELFPKNMGYLKDIIHSETNDDLKEIYDRMTSNDDADISFKADLNKIDWSGTIKFDDQKRILIKLLDKNNLYYNFSEIEDACVYDLLSNDEFEFNKSFYTKEGL